MFSSVGLNRSAPASGDADLWMRPRLDKGDASHRGLLFAHAGATVMSTLFATTAANTYRLLATLADAGFAVAANDMGGQSPMGNPTAQTRLGEADAWCISAAGVGASTSQRVAVGYSQGATGVINYFGKSPGHVADLAALILILPALDLDFYYQNDTSGTRAAIEAAWSITYPDALPANADPQTNMTLIAAAEIPTRIYIAGEDGDPIQTAAMAAANLAALGGNGSVIALSGTTHDDTTVGTIDRGDLLNWLQSVAPWMS